MSFDPIAVTPSARVTVGDTSVTAEYSRSLNSDAWSAQFRVEIGNSQKPKAGEVEFAEPGTKFRDENGNIIAGTQFARISAKEKPDDSVSVAVTTRFEPQGGVGVPEAGAGVKVNLDTSEVDGKAAFRVFTPGLGNGGAGLIITTDGDAAAFSTNGSGRPGPYELESGEIPDPEAPPFNGNNAQLLK